MHLPLIEFAYSNSYHASIEMAPYEALYGEKMQITFVLERWRETIDRSRVGADNF